MFHKVSYFVWNSFASYGESFCDSDFSVKSQEWMECGIQCSNVEICFLWSLYDNKHPELINTNIPKIVWQYYILWVGPSLLINMFYPLLNNTLLRNYSFGVFNGFNCFLSWLNTWCVLKGCPMPNLDPLAGKIFFQHTAVWSKACKCTSHRISDWKTPKMLKMLSLKINNCILRSL